MSEVTEKQLEDMEALFVQTAASMTSDRGTITLHGLSPSTLYFADRPQRDVGHMTLRSLRRQLGSGGQQLRGQPAERRPVVRGAGRQASRGRGRGHPGSAPGRRRAHLQHQAPDGTVPAATGPCALFIDPFGRPLSPVSAAGMHRRERRRMR